MYDIIELNNKLVSELKEIALKLNIPKADKLKKQDLIYKILDYQALNPESTNSIKQAEKLNEKYKDRNPAVPEETDNINESNFEDIPSRVENDTFYKENEAA